MANYLMMELFIYVNTSLFLFASDWVFKKFCGKQVVEVEITRSDAK